MFLSHNNSVVPFTVTFIKLPISPVV